jgi:hypothetical protein
MRLERRTLLTALDALLLITILVAGLAALLTLIAAVASASVTDLPVDLPTDELRAALPSGVSLQRADAFVTADVGLGHRLAWWLVGPAGLLMVVAGTEILRQVVATARTGDPLVDANVRRFHVLAALALGYFVMGAARSFVAALIQDDLGLVEVGAPNSPAPIVVALVALGLAQVWRRGVGLHTAPGARVLPLR